VLWDLVVLAKVEKRLGGRERLDKRRAPRLEARARRAADLAESRAALFLWRAL
jgi:hypothetical protein